MTQPGQAVAGPSRRRIRGAAFAIALAAFGWGLFLLAFGGVTVHLGGRVVSSNSALRPFVLSILSLLLFVARGGSASDVVRWTRLTAATAYSIDHRAAAAALAAAMLLTGLAYEATAVGAADSYGYVSEADLWTHGWPRVEQPWSKLAPWPFREATFAPLGYRTSSKPGEASVLVPSYSAGYPLLMALAKRVVGLQEAIFWVVPVSGALLVLATYGIGSRLGSSPTGLVAAWLVATSPTVLFMLMLPMSDVVTAAAWACAFYFLLHGRPSGAAAAGFFTGLAILIRPNLVTLAPILGAWYLFRWWQDGPAEGPRALREGVIYSLGALCGAAAVAVINERLYGSPFESGYGSMEGWFAGAHVWPNVRNYLGWLIDSQTPAALVGFAAICLPIRRLWPGVPHRSILLVMATFVAVLWATYFLYLVFDAWWFLRFLLPSWPFIMLGVGAVASLGLRARPAVIRIGTLILLVVLGARGVAFSIEEHAFVLWKNERRYPAMALQVRRLTDPNSVMIAFSHSGSVRYYAGRMSLRYDWLERAWLDEAVSWFADRGVHPYFLLDEAEVPAVRQHFEGQRSLMALDRPPVFTYRGQQSVLLFDLLETPTRRPEIFQETFEHLRSIPPSPPPRLVFAR
jgi:hypothetical protein